MKKHANSVVTLEIEPYQLIRIISFIGLGFLLIRISEVIILLFIAFIIMSATKPAAIFLNKRFRLSEGISMGLVVTSILLILIIAIYAISRPLGEEITRFAEHVPALSVNIAEWVSDIPYLKNAVNEQEITAFFSTIFSNVVDQFNSIANTLGSAIVSAFRGLLMILFIIIFSIYLFLDRNVILNFIIRFFSANPDSFNNVYNRVETQLGSWVRGQLLLCFAVGFLTYIGLVLLGVKYALPLAILAGILEIIPIMGPLVTGIIITLVGLSISPFTGILTLILSIAIQQLENNFLVPIVMRKAIGISPVLTIISLLIGQELFGILGALISVPAAAMLSVIVSHHLEMREQKND